MHESLLLIMAGQFPPHVGRSRDAPMDYQWTNRTSVKPAWATKADEPSTPRKRASGLIFVVRMNDEFSDFS